jgi:flavodoxin
VAIDTGWTAGASRRSILRGALLAFAGGTAAGCTPPDPSSQAPSSSSTDQPAAPPNGDGAPGRVLLAYFSRAGENYHYGGRRDLKVGNTDVLADLIGRLTGCDVHRIEAADPYPAGYDATVRRNTTEQDANARPGVANPLRSIQHYDAVLASPIWGGRAPMLMSTFTEALTFTGVTVHPVTTHAMSGLGSTERDYAASCRGAQFGEGLAVQGERTGDAGPQVEAWLRRIGLLRH